MRNDVTIGVPLYKAEKYVKNAMDSALSQSYPYIDFLVIDDGSDDLSLEIVRQLQETHPRGKNIRILRHDHNQGIGETRNHLIDEARTKYFFFLDADDTITENAIQILHDEIVRYKAELVYGSHEQIDLTTPNHIVTPTIYKRRQFLQKNEYPIYVYRKYEGIQAPVWNMLFDLEWFRSTGLRFLPINYWEDFSLTMDLATYASRVVLLSDVTYYYYRHSGTLSNTNNKNGIRKETIQKTIEAIEHVKSNSERIKGKPYFPGRMVKVLMTDFYIVCNILKNKQLIQPSFSRRELRSIMKSPLGFVETMGLKNRKLENLFLYALGILPPFLSVAIIKVLGKHRGLI